MEYEVKANQTLIDIALQLYGNPEAVARLLELNPDLANRNPAFGISNSVTEGLLLNYDTEGEDKHVLKEFDGKIIISE